MKKVFFIGICGISMSGLAILVKKLGYFVKGCDRNFKKLPKVLIENEIKVFSERKLKEIEDCDLVVFSSAIGDENPVLKYAKKLKKICISRGELLGEISKGYEKTIAVAGSHGKTTTTAMIYNCLYFAGKKPTLHLGGVLKREEANVVIGEREFFVTEACEYHDNFLFLKPYISVVTNVEKEHMDYFKTFANEKASYEKFKQNSEKVVEKTKYNAKFLKINSLGGVSFTLFEGTRKLVRINLKVGGFFNVENALFAIQACRELGLSLKQIVLGLESFYGTKKRLEKVEYLNKKIIVDYAHHPTEIANSLKFLKKLSKKLLIIFQPHTYSRTKDLFNDFVNVFSKVDNLCLFKTYEAREKPQMGVSAKQLYIYMKNAGKNVCYYSSINKIKKVICQTESDIQIVIMGAGDLPERLSIT